MENQLDAAHRAVYALVAPQLALDDLDVVLETLQVPSISGREVVDYPHGVSALEKRSDEVGADKAGAACDKNSFGHWLGRSDDGGSQVDSGTIRTSKPRPSV